MPVSAKPRRKHRPVPTRNATLSRRRDGWLSEGQVYSALLALEAEELHPTHLAWLVSHGTLVYRVAAAAGADAIQARALELLKVCAGIRDRAGNSGMTMDDVPLKVSTKEEIRIRALTWETLPWLREQPNHAVFSAVSAALEDLDAASGPDGAFRAPAVS